MKKIVNQDNVNDRVGFNHVMSMVGVWTLLLHLAAEVWRGRGPVARDIQDDLYSKFAYIFTKVSGYLFNYLSIYQSININIPTTNKQSIYLSRNCHNCLNNLSATPLWFLFLFNSEWQITSLNIKDKRVYQMLWLNQTDIICISLDIYLSIYLSIFYISIHPSIYTSMHPSIHLSIYISIYLSIYLSRVYTVYLGPWVSCWPTQYLHICWQESGSHWMTISTISTCI